MVGETHLRVQPGHPNVHTRLLRVAVRIQAANLAQLSHCRVEQYDVDVVVMFPLALCSHFLERATLHFSQRMVTPSLVAPKSGSPRNCGTTSSRANTVSLKMVQSSPKMKSLMTPSFLRRLNDFRKPT